MAGESDTIACDIDSYLKQQQHKGLLRFITCGSVDDGKSTIIGRLLHDSKALFEDQLATLRDDSKRTGTRDGEIDYALLLDGLDAEREQGITIDVAYRFFSTCRRKFIVADAPGHEQYTRNMVTGASTADLAVVLVDARKGVLEQTRRHSYLARLLGIQHVVLAVNKMDLVAYAQSTFKRIEAEYLEFAQNVGLEGVLALPISGVMGDNIVARSVNTPWYAGPALMEHLEAVELDEHRLQRADFRLPVQWVNRANPDFRGYAGTIASGVVRPGDEVLVLPSGRKSRVARIVTADGDLPQAVTLQSVTLTLTDEVDVSRGDILCHLLSPAEVSNQFEATLVWMSQDPLLDGRNYLMRLGTKTVTATVKPLKYKVNINTLEHLATETLEMNEVGVAELQLDRAVAFDPYIRNRDTGSFILIDRLSNATVGAGMLHFALHRASNISWQTVEVNLSSRHKLNAHGSAVVWLTGLSGAGKSTLANLIEKRLHAAGKRTYLLDGDNIRHGLNKDLGFTAADRVENIRRVAEVSKLMADAGLIVITALISPFRAERLMARELLGSVTFMEVHVDTPLEVAESRDPKGLYKKARRGELKNFTGIDSPYEVPEAPELRLDTTMLSPEEGAERIYNLLATKGVLEKP